MYKYFLQSDQLQSEIPHYTPVYFGCGEKDCICLSCSKNIIGFIESSKVLEMADKDNQPDFQEFLEEHILRVVSEPEPLVVMNWPGTESVNEEKLLVFLNQLWEVLPKIKYQDFNFITRSKKIKELGQANPEMGILNNLFSTVWLISRITEILVNKKLAVCVDEKENITGWQWYVGENND